jgi:hypothetical protein
MRFKTRSGSQYQINDGLLVRLSEHKLVDRHGFAIDDIVRFEPVEAIVRLEVGHGAVIDLVDGPRISTTRVVEIFD